MKFNLKEIKKSNTFFHGHLCIPTLLTNFHSPQNSRIFSANSHDILAKLKKYLTGQNAPLLTSPPTRPTAANR